MFKWFNVANYTKTTVVECIWTVSTSVVTDLQEWSWSWQHKTRCPMSIVIKAKDTWWDGDRDGEHQVAMHCSLPLFLVSRWKPGLEIVVNATVTVCTTKHPSNSSTSASLYPVSPPDNTFALPTEVFSSCLAIVSAVTVGGLFVAGPAIWNWLPDSLRDPAISRDSFRRSLKTFLFAAYLCT